MNNEERIKFANNEIIRKGNLDIVSEIFSTDYIVHTGGRDYKGHKSIKQFISQLHSAIPDIQVIKVEILNSSNNTITWQRTITGTHKKNMMGIPATGQKIKWTDMVVTRFDENMIIEEWTVSELLGKLLLNGSGKM